MPGGSFVAEDGGEAIFSMGCYGMGVSRLLAVVAEEYHDDRGLVWPAGPGSLPGPPGRPGRRPVPRGRRGRRRPATTAWWRPGVEVLYDDRDVSPGVKFADADLIGVPVRLVVGAKGVARGDRGVAVPGDRRGARGRPRRPGGGPCWVA